MFAIRHHQTSGYKKPELDEKQIEETDQNCPNKEQPTASPDEHTNWKDMKRTYISGGTNPHWPFAGVGKNVAEVRRLERLYSTTSSSPPPVVKPAAARRGLLLPSSSSNPPFSLHLLPTAQGAWGLHGRTSGGGAPAPLAPPVASPLTTTLSMSLETKTKGQN